MWDKDRRNTLVPPDRRQGVLQTRYHDSAVTQARFTSGGLHCGGDYRPQLRTRAVTGLELLTA